MRLFLAALALVCFSPAFAHAQFHQSFTIENFSVYSTLPDSAGNRHVAISFRVVNHSTFPVFISKQAVVTIGQASTRFPFPNLPNGGAAFISDAFATKATTLTISITLENYSVAAPVAKIKAAADAPFTYTAHLDQPEPSRWQSIGPSKFLNADQTTLGVGRVTTIAIDPRSPDTVYVGARGSGIWKTIDAGANWLPLSDSFPSVHIDAIAIDPANPNRVLAASPAGFFQSLDAGNVWTLLSTEIPQPWGSDGAALLVGPAPSSTLYLPSLEGLHVSTDGGYNWSLVLGGSSPVDSLQFNTNDPSILYASIAASNPVSAQIPVGVYIGLNSGLTYTSWHQLHGCPSGPLPAIPTSARVWIAQSGQTFWMSFLAGAADNSIRQLWRTTSITCQASGYTENSWVQIPISPGCDTESKDNSSFLFMHPDSANIVFKAGRPLCRTNGGGSPETVPGLHDDQHSIAVAPSNHSVMYIGNDGGIARSDDFGAHWHFVGEGLAISEELAQDTGSGTPFLITGTQDNGSGTWDAVSPVWNSVSGGDRSLVVFDRSNANINYQVAQGLPDVHQLTGTSDQQIGDLSKLPTCYSYDETPTLLGGLATTGSSPPIVVACNGLWLGPPWQQVDTSAGNLFNRVKSSPSGIFLAGTTDGRVFGGSDITALAQILQADPMAAISDFALGADSTTFYVSTQTLSGSGRIYRLTCPSASGGPLSCTALDLSPGVPSGQIMALSVLLNTNGNLLIAISSSGLFRGVPTSAANTFTWTPFNNGLPENLTATHVSAIGSGVIFLATWGRGTFIMYPPPPPHPSATGHVKTFRQERLHPGQPVGANNPLLTIVTMDSTPVFAFSATNLSGSYVTILKNALGTKRLVTITYQPISVTSGTILSVQ